MSLKTKFQKLKKLNLRRSFVTLAIVKEYKLDRISQYNVKYVQIDRPLEKRLRNILARKIENANSFEKYTFDCPEPEADQVRVIQYEETDFYRILKQLIQLNPEEDIVKDVDELVKAKAYLIILRNSKGIRVVGYKTLPENWKMKRAKGLIPLLFRENRFEDLEQKSVFSIANAIDVIYFDEALFILSKKEFERGLNFRAGMLTKAEEFYKETKDVNLFVNMEILKNRVGNNQRYLRKIATIKNLGYYHDPQYLERLQQISRQNHWNIEFENGQIIITEENLDAVLTVLQNKRLHSELTEEDFDVESAKRIGEGALTSK